MVSNLQLYIGITPDGIFGALTEKVLSTKIGKLEANKEDVQKLKKAYLVGKKQKANVGSIPTQNNELQLLIIHASATPEGLNWTHEEITLVHMGIKRVGAKEIIYKGKKYPTVDHLPVEEIYGKKISTTNGNGWSRVGYSDVILINGDVINMIPYDNDNVVDSWELSNGAKGYNRNARHVCYIGGKSKDFKEDKDTRTVEQLKSMEVYVKDTIKRHPKIKVGGHNQISYKSCPCFNVAAWLQSIGVKEVNIYKQS
jgi:N-acetylmuramoyl-L-alanine amidase